jgi:molybdopterin-guanine dinucleotide biosynthesis protein A
LVAIAVDMPFIERPQLEWLIATLMEQADRLGAMCRVEVAGEALIEPFPCAFRLEAKGPIMQRLADGRRSVHGLCDGARFVAVPAPVEWRPETWTNLNDRAALSAFEASRGKAGPERST